MASTVKGRDRRDRWFYERAKRNRPTRPFGMFGDLMPLDIFRADREPESRLPHAGSSVNRKRVDEGRRDDV